jgi:alanyl-tRNA synthetase
MYRDAVAGSVRVLSVAPSELPAAVERIESESKDLRKTLKSLQERLAVHEAAPLLDRAQEVAGVRLVVEVLEGRDAGGIKAVASAATAEGRACVALLSPPAVVIARSAGVLVDANAMLRQLLERFGGRGGGKPDLAQGGGLTGAPQEIAAAARALLESALKQS